MKCRHGLDIYETGPRDSGYPCSCCGRVEVDPLRSGFLCLACFHIEHGLAAPAEASRACTVRLAPTLESMVAGLDAIAPECQTDSASRFALVLARQAVALCEEARGECDVFATRIAVLQEEIKRLRTANEQVGSLLTAAQHHREELAAELTAANTCLTDRVVQKFLDAVWITPGATLIVGPPVEQWDFVEPEAAESRLENGCVRRPSFHHQVLLRTPEGDLPFGDVETVRSGDTLRLVGAGVGPLSGWLEAVFVLVRQTEDASHARLLFHAPSDLVAWWCQWSDGHSEVWVAHTSADTLYALERLTEPELVRRLAAWPNAKRRTRSPM